MTAMEEKIQVLNERVSVSEQKIDSQKSEMKILYNVCNNFATTLNTLRNNLSSQFQPATALINFFTFMHWLPSCNLQYKSQVTETMRNFEV